MTKNAVALICPDDNGAAWHREILTVRPDLDLRRWPDVGNPEEISYAIVARVPRGSLQPFTNLRAILSTWAGVEGLVSDDSIPDHLPIVRMVEPSLTQGMVEYVCCHVLNEHLRTRQYKDRAWQHPQKSDPRFAPGTTVGILGLGALGSACATALVSLGFDVNGWSRTAKNVSSVRGFVGNGELPDFLASSSIVVGLLPNTPATRGILNHETLKLLPAGASVINAGRGEQIEDADLLAALDSGHVASAVLDVFHQEPLPDDHPYWDHPAVTVSPHVASVTSPVTAVPVLMESLRRLQAGEPVDHLLDRTTGY